MYNRVLKDEERTNNYAEAANRSLHAAFDVDHPTVWKFIDRLKSVQSGNDKKYYEFVRGGEPPSKRTMYEKIDKKIRKIVSQFDKRSITEYLEGISAEYMK